MRRRLSPSADVIETYRAELADDYNPSQRGGRRGAKVQTAERRSRLRGDTP